MRTTQRRARMGSEVAVTWIGKTGIDLVQLRDGSLHFCDHDTGQRSKASRSEAAGWLQKTGMLGERRPN